MRTIRYAFEEALVNLRRNGRSAAMSVGTIAIAFLTLGIFLLAATNVQAIVERWSSAAEMSIYLRDDADEAIRGQLTAELKANGVVAEVEYVTKEQALARFKSDFPELGDIAEAGTDNPFPASLEVRLRPDVVSDAEAQALAERVGARPDVADVRYDRQWLERLMAIVSGLRLIGVAIAAVLILGAGFTVAAVVRLSLQARLDEIDIMQLVGAPYAFMRGPSIAEGTVLGGLGSALSLLLLWGVFVAVRGRLDETLAGFADVGRLGFLGAGDAALLIIGGLIVGGLAGWLASRSIRG